MMNDTTRAALQRATVVFAFFSAVAPLHAQDRLKSMPGYDRYSSIAPQIFSAVAGAQPFGRGGAAVSWSADGKSVEFTQGGKRMRYDVTSKKVMEAAPAATQQGGGRGRGGAGGGPARGRQFDFAVAPAGNHRAIYKDRNLWIGDSTGAGAVQITTDGSDKARIKYGTASWVYGEELDQSTAMWWSPDGKKLAFYRFDESKVPDFYLATNLTLLQDSLDVEAYPKSGAPNPVVDLFVYDVDTKATTSVDVRDGKPFENDVGGCYAYHVARWVDVQ